jgi:hypothetical protein
MRRKEKLETRVQALLDEVLEGTEDAAAATTVLRTLDTYLLNVIKNPFVSVVNAKPLAHAFLPLLWHLTNPLFLPSSRTPPSGASTRPGRRSSRGWRPTPRR